MSNAQYSPYQGLGGEVAVRALVDDFYDLMDNLPEARRIRALHPEDLSESRNKLFKFLSGWLGGPQLYIKEYGHPRLRARHLPFSIGIAERDAWLHCMELALQKQSLDPVMRGQLLQSIRNTANHMRNREETEESLENIQGKL